jgi:putative FmdB family regulatory protein
MPKYDYKCDNCETVVEVQKSINDSSSQVCQSCGNEMVKVYSSVGVTFKGSGFYRTDNRGSNG